MCWSLSTRKDDEKYYKDYLIDFCNKRSELWAVEVRVRLQGCVNDCQAADVQYHCYCMSKFVGKINISSSIPVTSQTIDDDEAIQMNIRDLVSDDKGCTWNFTEYSIQISVENI